MLVVFLYYFACLTFFPIAADLDRNSILPLTRCLGVKLESHDMDEIIGPKKLWLSLR